MFTPYQIAFAHAQKPYQIWLLLTHRNWVFPRDFSNASCASPISKWIFTYYIHTEKYSPKSYVVNFRTQISSSQSEERTMVLTREKNDTSNQNRERCFFMCEKNDTSNQKQQRCVSFEL